MWCDLMWCKRLIRKLQYYFRVIHFSNEDKKSRNSALFVPLKDIVYCLPMKFMQYKSHFFIRVSLYCFHTTKTKRGGSKKIVERFTTVLGRKLVSCSVGFQDVVACQYKLSYYIMLKDWWWLQYLVLYVLHLRPTLINTVLVGRATTSLTPPRNL